MISYVTYDSTGKLTGSYLQAVQPAHEAAHIIVTDAERITWVNYRANTARDGIELAPVVTPQPAVPQSVPMRSARRILYTEGLLATVESIIANMTGSTGDLARIDWATAQTVQRTDPLVVTIIPALGKSEAQIDAMFIAAAAL